MTLWDVATGKAKFVFEHVVANTIASISFSPDGTTLASCAAGRWGTSSAFIFLWDVETGEKKSEIEIPELPACSTFSPDGTTLAIGTTGFRNKAVFVYLWDIHENVEIAIFEIATLKPPRKVDYVKFSPDGTALAAGIGDNFLITLWDVVTRRETSRLHGYIGRDWKYLFAFSPDGRYWQVSVVLLMLVLGMDFIYGIFSTRKRKKSLNHVCLLVLVQTAHSMLLKRNKR